MICKLELEDLRLYLPKFLSTSEQQGLFSELRNFPENIDDRLYASTNAEHGTLLQGDGLTELLLVNLPTTVNKKGRGIVLSNTCDIALENKRLYETSICYAPIFRLRPFLDVLKNRTPAPSDQDIDQFEQSLRRQRVTQMFFLPKGARLDEDSFVSFDRLVSCQNSEGLHTNLLEKRLFSLSNYGYYLFLLKLSIHFCRIADGGNRSI